VPNSALPNHLQLLMWPVLLLQVAAGSGTGSSKTGRRSSIFAVACATTYCHLQQPPLFTIHTHQVDEGDDGKHVQPETAVQGVVARDAQPVPDLCKHARMCVCVHVCECMCVCVCVCACVQGMAPAKNQEGS